MSNPSVRGYVAVKLYTVAGFIMYEGEYDHYNIINLGVHSKFRRKGIGSLLLDRMKSRLDADQARDHLRFDVRETNLPTQLFLRNNGFLATGVLRRYFKDYWTEDGPPEVEDAYNFCFRGNVKEKHATDMVYE